MDRILRAMAALLALISLLTVTPALAEQVASYDVSSPQNLTPSHLYAQSALLVDERTGETLFSKDSRVRMFPASTTKIMTLLLALESDVALDAQVTIPREAADIPEGSSVIPVKPGDVTAFSDLLYGFMLSSGNDGANAIAVLTDGSIEAFVSRMNERAAQLGCEGTHFTNAHGYHEAAHYSTAQDLAVIAREAMKNPVFRQIVAAPTWTMHIVRNGQAVEQEIVSRNSLLQKDEKYYYPDCTGIKTGHHHKAGWCFVGSAQRDGKQVICVVLNCEGETDKWYDAAKLFEYGFTRYSPVTIADLLEQAKGRFAAAQIDDADPADPQAGYLSLELSDIEGGEQAIQLVTGSQAALDDAIETIVQGIEVKWDRPLKAPVQRGERLGRIELTLPDGLRAGAALVASRDVSTRPTSAPTQAVTPTAAATREADPIPKPEPAGDSTGVIVLAIIALLALLGAICAALAIRLQKGGKRRRRRARRRGQR